MILDFDSVYSADMTASKVILVTGQHNLFNKIVVDRARAVCNDIIKKQVGLSDDNIKGLGNNVDIKQYMQYYMTQPIIGTWFCYVNYIYTTDKEKQFISDYIKKSNGYGMLVVEYNDFKDYVSLLRIKILETSENVQLWKLSFPKFDFLISYLRNQFKGKLMTEKVIRYFINRVGREYDSYNELVDRVMNYTELEISLPIMKKLLADVENYELSDFIQQVMYNVNDKAGRRHLMQMYSGLKEDYNISAILRKEIETFIQARLLINKGFISGGRVYSVKETQDKLEDNHNMKKFSRYKFKKYINTASQVTLKDLLVVKVILANKFENSDKQIYKIINRRLLKDSE